MFCIIFQLMETLRKRKHKTIYSAAQKCFEMEVKMDKEKRINTYPNGQQPANSYDDGNIPQEDLPINIIPDEVPRKDGPGGED